MIIRKTRPEEGKRVNTLFAIAFEQPMENGPGEEPGVTNWGAFEEDTMFSTFAVTDFTQFFDGNQVKMGGIGGVAGAALLGVIYAAATGGPMAEYALICAVGALISMVGDLAASAIKRNQGIKDYGKLIPGDGGILDRFDSVIFTAPAIYFLAKLVLGI